MRIDIKPTAYALSACAGKVKHETLDAAEKNAQSVRRRRKQPVRAYQCRECGSWHVGGR